MCVLCAEEMWTQVSPQLQSTHTHLPPQPCIFHCSPLISEFVAIDLGSETNGFWFLGQETQPNKVGGWGIHGSPALQLARRGWGVWEPFSSVWPLFISGLFTSHPKTSKAQPEPLPQAKMVMQD